MRLKSVSKKSEGILLFFNLLIFVHRALNKEFDSFENRVVVIRIVDLFSKLSI